MNWFSKYKMANLFYDYVTKNNNMRIAAKSSTRYKKSDMLRWGLIHEILANELGIDPNDSDYFDRYQELATIFCELTDELGHLPGKNEFMEVWSAWQNYKWNNNASMEDIPQYMREA